MSRIVGTGIDIIEISRIEKSMKNPRFLTRVFSAEEQKLFQCRRLHAQTVAANFAAKEAFVKALGTGFRAVRFCEIAVLRDEMGKPYFAFTGDLVGKVKGLSFTLSISHCKEYAVASVIALKELG